jgi:hypothetical protein
MGPLAFEREQIIFHLAPYNISTHDIHISRVKEFQFGQGHALESGHGLDYFQDPFLVVQVCLDYFAAFEAVV